MKRRITLSIALVLSIVSVSLTISESAVNAQGNFRHVADSGVTSLGPDQTLRLTVTGGDINGDVRVRFKRIKYMDCPASPKICIESQTVSPVMPLSANEAASTDATGGNWRIIIESNNQNVRTNGIVFDTSTQRIVAMCCTSQTMYWP